MSLFTRSRPNYLLPENNAKYSEPTTAELSPRSQFLSTFGMFSIYILMLKQVRDLLRGQIKNN